MDSENIISVENELSVRGFLSLCIFARYDQAVAKIGSGRVSIYK